MPSNPDPDLQRLLRDLNRHRPRWNRSVKVEDCRVWSAQDVVGTVRPLRLCGSDQVVFLERTDCHLGGQRTWFLCPSCGRRCARLYQPPTGNVGCAGCLRLSWPSQRRSAVDRAFAAAGVLEKRLGGNPWWRPKWMRTAKYLGLLHRYVGLRAKGCRLLAEWAEPRDRKGAGAFKDGLRG